MKYLVDTNVIANYTAGVFSEKAKLFLAEIINKTPTLSVITKIETLSWRSTISKEELLVQFFVEISNIIPLTNEIVEKCIEIRRNHKIKTPDAIIAATALVNNLTLLTSDSDFKNIPYLRIINPLDL